MDFDKLYADVMKTNSTIRYAVIQNNAGEKICGGFRDDINPILNDDELKMMHYYASQRWQTRKNIEHKLGNTKYAMAEYGKLKRITFPINGKYMLLLTTEVSTDHVNVIDKVLELICDIKK
ncbi:MAG: hypothetical protein OEL52_03395 [Nitrosopumilus sp.]|nr:hypothetical protein [Nitrosopumilus sp.]